MAEVKQQQKVGDTPVKHGLLAKEAIPENLQALQVCCCCPGCAVATHSSRAARFRLPPYIQPPAHITPPSAGQAFALAAALCRKMRTPQKRTWTLRLQRQSWQRCPLSLEGPLGAALGSGAKRICSLQQWLATQTRRRKEMPRRRQQRHPNSKFQHTWCMHDMAEDVTGSRCQPNTE